MIWEIYSYWNIQELRGVFEAIAMLTNSADYSTLIASMMVFGVGAVALGVLGGNADLMQAWKWFIMSIFFYFVMFVPKTDVALIDRTGTTPATTVSNVPLSVALFGHLTSKLGDWMATSYDTAMGVITPSYVTNNMQFTGQGLMFGQKVIQEAQALNPSSVAFKLNMNNFLEKCVFPEFDTGNILPSDVVNSNNAWGAMSNVNPSLYITLVDANGAPAAAPTDCKTAYDSVLTPLLTNEANTVLGQVAGKIYPKDAAPIAKVAMDSALATSYQYMFGVSESATDIIKQRLIANTYLNASSLTTKDIYAKTQAEVLASQQYSTLSQIAQTTIPKLRNVIEIVIYAVFPVILVMIIIGGSKGLLVIKSYAVGLLWIQLWAPLYAVMNYLMTSYRQSEWLAQVNPANALSISHSNLIQAGSQSDMNIAGMLAIAIPMLAYAIVKGGEMAMTSFVSGAVAPAQMAASRASSDVAMGNLSQGNVSADTKSFQSLSALNYDMQPRVNMGAVQQTNGSGNTFTTDWHGNTAINSSAMQNNNALMNVQSALQHSEAYERQYKSSLDASKVAGASAGFEVGGALATTGSISAIANNGTAWGEGLSAKYGTNTQETFQKMEGIAKDVSKKTGLHQEEASGLVMGLAASAGTDLELNAKIEGAKKFGDKAVAEAMKGIKSIDSEDVKNAAAFSRDFVEDENLQKKFDVSDSNRTELRAANERKEQFKKTEEAKLKESKEYHEKWDESDMILNAAMIELGAATPYSALSGAAQRFVKEEGRNYLAQASQAMQAGNMNAYENAMQAFNSGVNRIQSEIPGAPTRPTEPLGVSQSKDDIYRQHETNKGTVSEARAENKELVKTDPVIAQTEQAVGAQRGQAKIEEDWKKELQKFEKDGAYEVSDPVRQGVDAKTQRLKNDGQVKNVDSITTDDNGTMRTNDYSTTVTVGRQGYQAVEDTINNALGEDSYLGNKAKEGFSKTFGDDRADDANPNHTAPGAGVQGTPAYIDGPNPTAQPSTGAFETQNLNGKSNTNSGNQAKTQSTSPDQDRKKQELNTDFPKPQN